MKAAKFFLPLALSVALPASLAAQGLQPLFIYPQEGQTQEQLDKDKAECEMWTFEQIGYPQGYTPPEDAGKGKVSKNAAIGTVAGAGLGAAAGAAGGKPGKGAAAGAAAGLIGGLIIGSKKKDKAKDEAAEQQASINQAYNDNYRRAMSACMGARGYSVE